MCMHFCPANIPFVTRPQAAAISLLLVYWYPLFYAELAFPARSAERTGLPLDLLVQHMQKCSSHRLPRRSPEVASLMLAAWAWSRRRPAIVRLCRSADSLSWLPVCRSC